jgi:hypothetical protein
MCTCSINKATTLTRAGLQSLSGLVVFLLGLSMFLLLPASVLAQPAPCPPPEFCVDGQCEKAQEQCSQRLASGLRKWNPGFYMQLLRNKEALESTLRFEMYNEIGASEALVGVMVPWRWSQLEGDVQGDYSKGIAAVRADIEKLKSLPRPKRFILKIIDFDYGATAVEETSYFPAYLQEAGLTYAGRNGVGFCRWDSAAMSHYIEMIKAYGRAFENEPFFEGIILYKETAPALNSTSLCGYSNGKYIAQTERMLREAVAAFPTTNVILAHNYFVDQSTSTKLIDFMAQNAVAIGGPDVLPPSCTDNTDGTWAYQGFRGDGGGIDYRGSIASIWSVEVSEMGLGLGNCTPDQLVRFANESLHATHLGIDRNNFAGGPENQWESVLTYISRPENALTNTRCPTSYSGRCQ